MRAKLERVVFDGASFLIFERVSPEFPAFWHYHPEFQLALMVDSHGRRSVGDMQADYGPGDLVLLGPNLPHTWRSQPMGRRQDFNTPSTSNSARVFFTTCLPPCPK